MKGEKVLYMNKQESDILNALMLEPFINQPILTDIVSVICQALNTVPDKIKNITVLKKGMTNRSFTFSCNGKKYIMRIPGEGTGRLVSRKHEADVYRLLMGKNICDSVVYINPANGYKITEFIEGARVCDALNWDDVRECMDKLREFHGLGLVAGHGFDIFGQIRFYESLRGGTPSVYKDYQEVKDNVFSLAPYISAHAGKKVLTHIDAVPDNFLFTSNGVRLVDWEYAGMQDPHVDIAMFAIYSMYDRRQADQLIDIYFKEGCPGSTRVKIYCYIAACGLLWSNWCEYKKVLGVEFGEYSLRQYNYAKDYYKIVQEELKKAGVY
ncbi:MAG: phosphotransferase [Lachnospiraceae bacterium]